MFISHLYVFFEEISSLAHFLIGSFIFLVLSCMSCLYILEINSLPVVLFAIIFSHSEGCLFTLLIVKAHYFLKVNHLLQVTAFFLNWLKSKSSLRSILEKVGSLGFLRTCLLFQASVNGLARGRKGRREEEVLSRVSVCVAVSSSSKVSRKKLRR